jgi:hypothetical protein
MNMKRGLSQSLYIGILLSVVAPAFSQSELILLPVNPLPSEQALQEIQQMSDIGHGFNMELRNKPGGGPGLGELPVSMDSMNSNMLALTFMGIVFLALKNSRKTEKSR